MINANGTTKEGDELGMGQVWRSLGSVGSAKRLPRPRTTRKNLGRNTHGKWDSFCFLRCALVLAPLGYPLSLFTRRLKRGTGGPEGDR